MTQTSRSKVNPRKIPRSQQDVDRAWDGGVNAGVSNATAIFLMVMSDKFGFGEKMVELWSEIVKLSEAVMERRVSIADIKHTLLTEYDIQV